MTKIKNFSLIICTYQRPKALLNLLNSVLGQSFYPKQILIIDGSLNDETKSALQINNYPNIEYFKVTPENRGLTRQRNFGISKIKIDVEVICFLDDDIILTSNYFENLINTYNINFEAIGVGGFIENEISWTKALNKKTLDNEFEYDGWIRKLGSRNLLRKKFGLLSKEPPGIMPEFSNGLSISFLPPSGKIYPVEFFMGGVSSYRKELFESLEFSSYFEGYGLYEDLDFCIRASKKGQLYVNTAAVLYHHHDDSGRPNSFKYGKMVIRNGWYVWRVKYPSPSYWNRAKWHVTLFLLTLVRLGNIVTTNQRKEAFFESLGRISGWWSLIVNKPRTEL